MSQDKYKLAPPLPATKRHYNPLPQSPPRLNPQRGFFAKGGYHNQDVYINYVFNGYMNI